MANIFVYTLENCLTKSTYINKYMCCKRDFSEVYNHMYLKIQKLQIYKFIVVIKF